VLACLLGLLRAAERPLHQTQVVTGGALRSSWAPLWVDSGLARGAAPSGATQAAATSVPSGVSARAGHVSLDASRLLHAAPLLEEDFEQALDDLERHGDEGSTGAREEAANRPLPPSGVGESRGDSLLAMLAADDAEVVGGVLGPFASFVPGAFNALPPSPAKRGAATPPMLDATALDATLRDDAPNFAVQPGPAPLSVERHCSLAAIAPTPRQRPPRPLRDSHPSHQSTQPLHLAWQRACAIRYWPCARALMRLHHRRDTFETPELPVGRQLCFRVLQTSGDEAWVGLAGIELFDANGMMLTSASVSVESSASEGAPTAVVGTEPWRLFDGVDLTCDDATCVERQVARRQRQSQHHRRSR